MEQDSIIVNLTSVDVRIVLHHEDADSKLTVYPRSGTVARVAETIVARDPINGIPSTEIKYGAVENLPEPVEGTFFIVSMPVGLHHNTVRTDLIGPNTSAAIRDTQGLIVGCPGFVRY